MCEVHVRNSGPPFLLCHFPTVGLPIRLVKWFKISLVGQAFAFSIDISFESVVCDKANLISYRSKAT
jgi:hypothetical protein